MVVAVAVNEVDMASTWQALAVCPSCGSVCFLEAVSELNEVAEAQPPSTLAWLRSYTGRVARHWPLWSIVLLWSWAAWAGGKPATAWFAMPVLLIALALAGIASASIPASARGRSPVFALMVLRVAAVLAVLGVLWGFVQLNVLVEAVAGRLERAGFPTDRDVLITAAATAVATVLAGAVTVALVRRLRSAAQPDALVVRYWRLALEASWTLGGITVALLPAVVGAGWLRNVALGLCLPLVVVHAREDRRAYLEQGAAGADRVLGRMLMAFLAWVSRMRVARAFDASMAPRPEKDFGTWLRETPTPLRLCYLGLLMIAGLVCVAAAIALPVWIATTGPMIQRISLLLGLVVAPVIVLKGLGGIGSLGADVRRIIQGLWRDDDPSARSRRLGS
jgi:hypothetical protein